jgi:hypothetical protein
LRFIEENSPNREAFGTEKRRHDFTHSRRCRKSPNARIGKEIPLWSVGVVKLLAKRLQYRLTQTDRNDSEAVLLNLGHKIAARHSDILVANPQRRCYVR